MNRNMRTFVLSLALTLAGSQLQAQFTTTSAKNVNPGQQSGFYYALPQTMLRIDFVIEETQWEQGPLAGYASTYFGTSDYSQYGSKKHKLLDVKMQTVANPDPNATFFVAVASGRGGAKADFDVLPNGIIRSIGVGATSENVGTENIGCQKAEIQKEEPVSATRRIMLMSAGKSDAQLAKEVADKIVEIRKAKFYLVSGDVAMASDPETFKTMCIELDEMEKEYMSLFTGWSDTKVVTRSVYVIPNKEIATQTVAKFSESEGLTVGTSGSGRAIAVQTLPLNTTSAINAPSQSAVESMSYENKVFYRVPELANVKVTVGNATLLEERVSVNQLGSLLMAPIANTRIVFDTETGQIVNMKMQ